MLTKPEPAPRQIFPDDIKTPPAAADAEQKVEYDDGLWAKAAPILITSYSIAFFIAVLTFKVSREALFSVVASIGLAIMFFTIPTLIARIRARRDPRWRSDPAHRDSDMVSTYTGQMPRREAVFHIVMPHLVVPILFAAFAVVRFSVGS